MHLKSLINYILSIVFLLCFSVSTYAVELNRCAGYFADATASSHSLSLENKNFALVFSEALKNAIDREEDVLNSMHSLLLRDSVIGPEFSPRDLNAKDIPEGMYKFEGQVFDALMEKRLVDLQYYLSEKLKFTPEMIFNTLTYYLTEVLNKDVPMSSDEYKLYYQKLSRLIFEEEHQQELEFYKQRLTKKSVPEIAEELNTSQSYVYGRLSQLQVSIYDQFNRRVTEQEKEDIQVQLNLSSSDYIFHSRQALDLLLTLKSYNKYSIDSLRGIATKIFHFGEQATEFIFHHIHLENRSNNWEQTVYYRQGYRTLTEVLIQLRGRKENLQSIAEVLTSLTGEAITEAAVSSKLSALGFVASQQRGAKELYLPEYGYLKKEGRIVPEVLFDYMLQEKQRDKGELSRLLQVQPASLDSFFQRHQHIFHLLGVVRLNSADIRQEKVTQVFEKGVLQQKYLEIFSRHLDLYPEAVISQKTIGEFELDKNWNMLFHRKYGVFSSKGELLLALKNYRLAEGKTFYIIKQGQFSHAKTKEHTPKEQEELYRLREILKQEAMDLVFEALYRVDGNSDLALTKSNLKKLQLNSYLMWSKFTGTANYAKGNFQYHNRIFDSTEDMYLMIKADFARRGKTFYILKQGSFMLLKDEVSIAGKEEADTLREVLKQEALELIFKAYYGDQAELDLAFTNLNLHKFKLNSLFTWGKLTGSGVYAEGRGSFHQRIFDSTAKMYLNIKAEFARMGKTFYILKQGSVKLFKTEVFTPKEIEEEQIIRAILKQEALELIYEARGSSDLKLSESNLKNLQLDSYFSWHKLTATSQYREGYEFYHLRIFDSEESMQAALLVFQSESANESP